MAEGVLSRADVFARLASELPIIGASEDPTEKIRAVLRLVLDRPRQILPAQTFRELQGAVAADPPTCPNCGVPVTSERSPYCSTLCREVAGFVRQFRASVDSGSILEADRQAGMGQALWSLLGGGYPHRQTMVPKRVITKVIERDGGICTICGAPATEIDHTGSG